MHILMKSATLLAMLFALTGCPEQNDPQDPPVEDMTPIEDMTPDVVDIPADLDMTKVEYVGLELDQTTLSLKPGDSKTLQAFLITSDQQREPRSVTWETSDRNVAIVSGGEVIGRRVGTATIKATLDNFEATCEVTVASNAITRVDIAPTSRTLPIGVTFEFFATFYDDADQRVNVDSGITWRSSDDSVATIDQTGKVTTLTAGQTTIEVSYEQISAQATLTVSADAPKVSSIQVLPSLKITRDQSKQLNPVAFDDNNMEVADPGWQYNSMDPTIASVDNNGTVRALKVGTTKILISAGGAQTSVDIEVVFEVSAIALGRAHACAIVDSSLYCWGANANGQLGRAASATGAPQRVMAPAVAWQSVSAGGNTTCAITMQEQLYCWGQGNRGQIGDGTTSDQSQPKAVGGQTRFKIVRVGAAHVCALDTADHYWCWGANDRGQVGDGTRVDATSPKRDVQDRRWNLIAAGGQHTCVVDASQNAWCWGANGNGQLGLTGQTDSVTPKMVVGGSKFLQLDLGDNHSCGITASGTPVCWGANQFGQAGEGSNLDRDVPIFLSTTAMLLKINTGSEHTCAYAVGGVPYCWGKGANGRLGTGNTANKNAPTQVMTSEVLIDTDAGEAFSCGISQTGKVFCWGDASEGQLGTMTNANVPVLVDL